MIQAGFQGVMVPVDPQLLQQGPEIQGVGAGGRPGQERQFPGAQFLGVLGQVLFDQIPALGLFQGRHRQGGPAPFGEVIEGPAGEGGQDEADVGGNDRRQPDQVQSTFPVL